MPIAFITGITGQTGSYLADLLINKGYEVHGLIRRCSTFNTSRIDHIYEKLKLHYGDLTDSSRITNLILDIKPDEIYNLAAQSHVRTSFDIPVETANVICIGALNILEAARKLNTKVYQASTSELFGNIPGPQNENTPFHPRSPYGCAKLFAHYQTINYREAYDLFACCGILFNHESPRRGPTFVTRKITRALTRIKLGLQNELILGNLNARRDWGYAGDYTEAIWLMLQQNMPDDYVIATGESHTVREFLELCANYLNLDWEKYIKIDPKYFRPSEVDYLLGDSTKARQKLNWQPKVSIKELVKLMIDSDLQIAQKELLK